MGISVNNNQNHTMVNNKKIAKPTVEKNLGLKIKSKWGTQAMEYIDTWAIAKRDGSTKQMQVAGELLDQHLMSVKGQPDGEKVMQMLKDVNYTSPLRTYNAYNKPSASANKLDHSV